MTEERRPCPKCGEMIAAQAVICRFCKADFRPAPPEAAAAPPPRKSRGFPILLILVLLAAAAVPFVAIVAAIAIPGLLSARRAAGERNASASLKMICVAEMDFSASDRDGNGVEDFWTGDVAGLYCLRAEGARDPIRLIDLSVAAADTAPVGEGIPADRRAPLLTAPRPKAGYSYRAMTHDGSGEPYRQDTKGKQAVGPYFHPQKFAFCAYPANYPKSGRMTFITDETMSIWAKDTRGEPVTRWPADPGAAGWRVLD